MISFRIIISFIFLLILFQFTSSTTENTNGSPNQSTQETPTSNNDQEMSDGEQDPQDTSESDKVRKLFDTDDDNATSKKRKLGKSPMENPSETQVPANTLQKYVTYEKLFEESQKHAPFMIQRDKYKKFPTMYLPATRFSVRRITTEGFPNYEKDVFKQFLKKREVLYSYPSPNVFDFEFDSAEGRRLMPACPSKDDVYLEFPASFVSATVTIPDELLAEENLEREAFPDEQVQANADGKGLAVGEGTSNQSARQSKPESSNQSEPSTSKAPNLDEEMSDRPQSPTKPESPSRPETSTSKASALDNENIIFDEGTSNRSPSRSQPESTSQPKTPPRPKSPARSNSKSNTSSPSSPSNIQQQSKPNSPILRSPVQRNVVLEKQPVRIFKRNNSAAKKWKGHEKPLTETINNIFEGKILKLDKLFWQENYWPTESPCKNELVPTFVKDEIFQKYNVYIAGYLIDFGTKVSPFYASILKTPETMIWFHIGYFILDKDTNDPFVSYTFFPYYEYVKRMKKVPIYTDYESDTKVHPNVAYFDHMYSPDNQKAVFEDLSAGNYQQYYDPEKLWMLVKQELTDQRGFPVMTHKRVALNYMNIAPMYKVVQVNAWRNLENFVLTLPMVSTSSTVMVITGTYGSFEINGNPVYLDNGSDSPTKRIKVPYAFYKLLHIEYQSPKIKALLSDAYNFFLSIVIVTHNNPFEENPQKICPEPVDCAENGWQSVEQQNYKLGFTYCCKLTPGFAEKLNIKEIEASFKTKEVLHLGLLEYIEKNQKSYPLQDNPFKKTPESGTKVEGTSQPDKATTSVTALKLETDGKPAPNVESEISDVKSASSTASQMTTDEKNV